MKTTKEILKPHWVLRTLAPTEIEEIQQVMVEYGKMIMDEIAEYYIPVLKSQGSAEVIEDVKKQLR